VQTNLQVWKIYLDTCCLSRLLDPPTQVRLIEETQAIRRILAYFLRSHWSWVCSRVVIDEVEQTPDLRKRIQLKTWLNLAHQTASLRSREISRGRELESLGFKEQDALHLACAESSKADVFLTTDDRLLKRAQSYQARLYIRVENPVTWLEEVTGSGPFRDDRS
jgi:predicted nucleic acid-binding protein